MQHGARLSVMDWATVDVKVGGSSSAMSSYVALTHVERRADLLMLVHFRGKRLHKDQHLVRDSCSRCGVANVPIGQALNNHTHTHTHQS